MPKNFKRLYARRRNGEQRRAEQSTFVVPKRKPLLDYAKYKTKGTPIGRCAWCYREEMPDSRPNRAYCGESCRGKRSNYRIHSLQHAKSGRRYEECPICGFFVKDAHNHIELSHPFYDEYIAEEKRRAEQTN